MSYRSLLFCQDEKAARVVTQVLSELDFTVELAHESFAAVQRLSEEQFHALVVDCQNEQDAALLFKAARNSAHNSGSLSVAVVEGQAGVARAFRIGANLVLTKPVNVEQSKGTLRVARGLLKKTQAKPAAPVAPVSPTAPVEAQIVKPQAAPPVPPAPKASEAASFSQDAPVPDPSFPMSSKFITPLVSSAPASTSSVPYSGLVLESEREPVTEAADAAVLESMPGFTGKRQSEGPASIRLAEAAPIAASTSGHAAAAVALAPEHKVLDFRTAGAAPMVTNEPIVASGGHVETYEEAEEIAAPTFSALDAASGRSAGGTRFLKIAVVLAVVAGGGYFALRQPKVQQYTQGIVERRRAAQAASAPDADSDPAPPATTQQPLQAVPSNPATQNAQPRTQSTQSAAAAAQDDIDPAEHATAPKSGPLETIEVQELPFGRDNSKITVTPKPQTIIVKSAPVAQKSEASVQPTAPPMNIISGAVSGTDSTLPNLAPATIDLPTPVPGTIRISQGVSQGLLMKKVQPVYPAVAKQFHKQGSVQLLTTIDKFGGIKKVQVLSGDSMLVRAAVDAVKQWEYRPYLLNGQPVEIETQITVVFKAPN